MESLREARGYDLVLLMVTDVVREGSEIVAVGKLRLAERALGRLAFRGRLGVDGRRALAQEADRRPTRRRGGGVGGRMVRSLPRRSAVEPGPGPGHRGARRGHRARQAVFGMTARSCSSRRSRIVDERISGVIRASCTCLRSWRVARAAHDFLGSGVGHGRHSPWPARRGCSVKRWPGRGRAPRPLTMAAGYGLPEACSSRSWTAPGPGSRPHAFRSRELQLPLGTRAGCASSSSGLSRSSSSCARVP
jgi:hypothetical protein